jgi:hypothetical protein
LYLLKNEYNLFGAKNKKEKSKGKKKSTKKYIKMKKTGKE